MPAPTEAHLAALAADADHAYQHALAAALANPALVWVVEEHVVGNETAPSARLFRTRAAALRVLAEEAAASRAEAETGGYDDEDPFADAEAYGAWNGGTEWRADDGSWRTLAPQAPQE